MDREFPRKEIPPWDPLIYDSYPREYQLPRSGPSNLENPNLQDWLLAFGFSGLTLQEGAFQISQAYRTGCAYTPLIIEFIQEILSSSRPEEIATRVGWTQITISSGRKEILRDVYWFRALRTVRPLIFLRQKGPVDMYLFASNPFERIPIQTFLSFMTDPQLERTGFNEEGLDRPKRLKDIVGKVLNQFGYIKIISLKPIRLEFIKNQERRVISLSSLSSVEPMALLRFYFQLEASRGWIDLTMFEPFLEEMKKNLDIYFGIYQMLLDQHTGQTGQTGQSEERFSFPCLVCQISHPDSDFPWCGHGICKFCQIGPQCQFCNEHFVCDSLSDQDVRNFEASPERKALLKERVEIAKSIALNRLVSFDFINKRIKYPW